MSPPERKTVASPPASDTGPDAVGNTTGVPGGKPPPPRPTTGPKAAWYRNDRFLYRLVAALTVAPILIAAVRDGLHGWVSTMDEAHTVISAKYALSFHPWLLGIYTDGSVWIHTAAFFAGPWWLWWISIALRVFGPVWGPLLAIAGLNALWILLAGWCVQRRLGPRAAMGALIFLGALTWALGTSAFHSPSGQVMIVPVFAAFCFVAWALAAGDEGVLWAFALITNFIVLDEVVLLRVVPVIAAVAVALWAFGLFRHRRLADPTWPQMRRRSLRALISAGVITVIMWVPSLVQEFTHHPGNLTNLWRIYGARPQVASVWGDAYGVLASFFTSPPFWLRGSRSSNLLMYSVPPGIGAQIVVGVLLGGLAIVLGTSGVPAA